MITVRELNDIHIEIQKNVFNTPMMPLELRRKNNQTNNLNKKIELITNFQKLVEEIQEDIISSENGREASSFLEIYNDKAITEWFDLTIDVVTRKKTNFRFNELMQVIIKSKNNDLICNVHGKVHLYSEKATEKMDHILLSRIILSNTRDPRHYYYVYSNVEIAELLGIDNKEYAQIKEECIFRIEDCDDEQLKNIILEMIQEGKKKRGKI